MAATILSARGTLTPKRCFNWLTAIRIAAALMNPDRTGVAEEIHQKAEPRQAHREQDRAREHGQHGGGHHFLPHVRQTQPADDRGDHDRGNGDRPDGKGAAGSNSP